MAGRQDGLFRVMNSLRLVSDGRLQYMPMADRSWAIHMFDSPSPEETISARDSRPERDTKIPEVYRSVTSEAPVLSLGWLSCCILTTRRVQPISLLQVREVALEMSTDYSEGPLLRWQSSALLALQEATEAYLVHLFEDA